MKEKKIIDGINVAECEFFEQKYRLNFCLAYETDDCAAFCQDHPNCYFKRLMHSREETEMYDRGLSNTLKALEEKTEELEILKVSYKTLKAEQEELEESYNAAEDELNYLENHHCDMEDIFIICKHVLKEIREIAESAPAIDTELSLRILEQFEILNELKVLDDKQ